jgi:hypothetical protein
MGGIRLLPALPSARARTPSRITICSAMSVLRDGIYVFGAEIFTDGFESGDVDMWSS